MTHYIVSYTNADGEKRSSVYWTEHHAEQHARAMRSSPHVSGVQVFMVKVA